MSASFEVVARSLRSGLTEDWHHGAAAVATPEGKLIARVGDPELPIFLRSVAKPVQALPLVLEGGIEEFDLTLEDLALICSSHYGTVEHEERAASILARAGFSQDDLQCGAHVPFDREARTAHRQSGEAARTLQNNCSGKHAGMLCACRLLGLPTEDYLESGHPLQQRIAREMALLAGLRETEIPVGVDGCSAPTFVIPLRSAARVYAALADPVAAGLDAQRVAAVERIVAAMASAPEMVAGQGQFTTRLIEATGGRLLGKEGAQGCYAVAVRGPVALGLVLKVAGGDQRCRPGVVLDLLRQLGALSSAEFDALEPFHSVELRNHRRLRVGELIPEVELLEV